MTSGRHVPAAAEGSTLRGSVSTSYVDGIVQFAVACGANRAALLAQLGLDDATLGDADRRLPLEALRRLFAQCATALHDPAFALHFGVGVPCGQLSLASALAAARPSDATAAGASRDPGPRTLADALTGLNRYASLGVHFERGPAERFRFAEDAGGVWLEDHRPDEGDDAWPALTESVMARFVTGIRRRGGEAVVRALEVRHDAPPDAGHRAAYATVFRVPVRFGATRNAVCLDPRFLREPLEPLPAPVETVLTRHAEATLRRLQVPRSWRQRVDAVLDRSVGAGDADGHAPANLAAVCRALAVSRQTLHRRLQAEGTTFAALHAEWRRRRADAMLHAERVPVAVVASRLGFSEAGAFSRAYKRWTGRRPSDGRGAG